MMGTIIYLLSVIFLQIVFIRMKKSEKEQNIILWFVLSIIFYMAFHSAIVFILSILHIKSFLILKAILNIIISLILEYFINRKNKQKYYFDYKDIVVFGILLISCIWIFNSRFTKEFNISFETTDPAIHFLVAEEYKEEKILLEFSNIVDISGSRHGYSTLFFSYVNLGTAFEVGNNLFKINDQTTFIIFEMCVLIFSGYLLYLTIRKNKEKISFVQIFLSLLISLIYLFGYPLNNLIFGFHYLGLGIVLINAILVVFEESLKENSKRVTICNYFLMGLLHFTLFTCYYLFVPAVYGGLGFYVLYLCFLKKQFSFKKAVWIIFITLVIPFIIGILYYILPSYFVEGATSSESALAMEGYIYRNLFGNFIFLFPAFISILYYKIRKKEFTTIDIVTIITIIFTLLILILGMFGKASSYYYFKLYYLMWLFIFLIIGKEIIEKRAEYKMTLCYFLFYLFIILALCMKIENKIASRNILFNPSNFVINLSDIYNFNLSRLDGRFLLNKESIELIDYIEKEFLYNDKKEIRTLGSDMQKIWIYSLKKIVSAYNNVGFGDLWGNCEIDEIIKNEEETILIFYDSISETDLNVLKKSYHLVFENAMGCVLTREI